METPRIDIGRTIRDKKFLSLIFIAVLLTSILPFPLLIDFTRDYSKMHELMDRMVKEDDAIACHRTLDIIPNTRNLTLKCDDEYYHPDERITECCGLSVYQSTYQEYRRVVDRVKRDLPKTIVASIWILLSVLFSYYALIDAAVSISQKKEVSIGEIIRSSLRAFPALIASEVLTFLVVLVLLLIVSIPLIIFGPLARIIEVIIGMPALLLVVPAYYFIRKVYVLDRIWNVVRNNPGGYIVLGIVGLVFAELSKLQYYHYFGATTLLLSAAMSTVGLIVYSLGGLEVYLSAEKSEGEREENPEEKLF
ncbi:hypothetical protein A3L09_05470 [Thermococcus profundus]|uniref:Uncharacterized protein n=1 Tax=Thermococcus profundus TaxID=49899 RepID=A0A2Z2M8D9_THEPR|nr:hypothetical protein [Thermococcus profundus]ASJ02740.1 hypothetical protein A3L09_05470 [Thermococcus profundus]